MSTRLRRPTHDERVLALLADGHPHSHHELYALGVIAHSRISSLRKKGHLIEQHREGDLYLYRLLSSAPAPTRLLPAGGGDGRRTERPGVRKAGLLPTADAKGSSCTPTAQLALDVAA